MCVHAALVQSDMPISRSLLRLQAGSVGAELTAQSRGSVNAIARTRWPSRVDLDRVLPFGDFLYGTQ